ATEIVLTSKLHHLRQQGSREWSSFPVQAQAKFLELKFAIPKKPVVSTLRLRQQDVKQPWQVLINGKTVGKLQQDENDMVRYLEVPANVLQQGANQLTLKSDSERGPDDIRVGEIVLFDQARDQVLGQGEVNVRVVDPQAQPLPCRLTILDAQGALSTVGAQSTNTLAVRPGIVYTANGQARFSLPAGQYRVIAGRGFEWSMDSKTLLVSKGTSHDVNLSIKREVPTQGLVSCDTHVHTFTYSR
ncbi:MAG: hypothetical protein GY888_27855, partial [Planctomycetaceae bacterium]|nr:hypothetical protein [Planctomycetaceae bacterium]